MKKILIFLLLAIVLVAWCFRSELQFLISYISLAEITEPTEATTGHIETYASIPKGVISESYTDPELERTIEYHMYIPENATENMPLIIYLHGVGAAGANRLNENNPLITKALEVYGEDFPFLILAPSSMTHKTWISKQMPERVKNLVDYIAELYNVDRSKIIITGHSMGANGVFRQIELYGNYYSAAIPISASDTSIIDLDYCLDVPIWGFAGSKEYPCDYKMHSLFSKLEEMEGNVKFTILEGVKHGDTANQSFLYDVFEWALAQ